MSGNQLPDGIYLGVSWSDTEARPIWAVQDGKYDENFPHRNGSNVPPGAADAWTKIGDLPDLRMAEPDQIGYPVMAGCATTSEPHLTTRRNVGTTSGNWPWACTHRLSAWRDVINPRDLTADEIIEHNLWTAT